MIAVSGQPAICTANLAAALPALNGETAEQPAVVVAADAVDDVYVVSQHAGLQVQFPTPECAVGHSKVVTLHSPVSKNQTTHRHRDATSPVQSHALSAASEQLLACLPVRQDSNLCEPCMSRSACKKSKKHESTVQAHLSHLCLKHKG